MLKSFLFVLCPLIPQDSLVEGRILKPLTPLFLAKSVQLEHAGQSLQFQQ